MSYHLVFWVCGAAHSLSWDYLPGIPQGEEAERRYSWREKPLGSLFAKHILHLPPLPSLQNEEQLSQDNISQLEKGDEKHTDTYTQSVIGQEPDHVTQEEADPDIQLVRRISRMSNVSYQARPTPASPKLKHATIESRAPSNPSFDSLSQVQESAPAPTSLTSVILRSVRPLTVIITPVTVAIAISLPIALIDDLKALFVDISALGGPTWHGPDGKPPLAFIIDTGQFRISSLAFPTLCPQF